MRILVDRTFKINSTWKGFHNNIKELTNILVKNQFLSCLVNCIVQQYLSKFFASTLHASAATCPNETSTHYYKLLSVGPFSSTAQCRIRHLTLSWFLLPTRSRTFFVWKMWYPKHCDHVLSINFLAQAVAPVKSARQTDVLLCVFLNI